MADDEKKAPSDFIRAIVAEDLASGKWDRIVTRFPPEPNGYPHIGHAKAIWISFGIARDFGGICRLRFDDTNPAKEEAEYVEAMQEGIRWLGFQWTEMRFTSDYFEQMYEHALTLVQRGLAYVCDLSPEQMREYRGTLTEPGRDSPYRDRAAPENLDLLERMRAGEFEEGARTLRARIDMASPNLNLRDPAIYRIQKTPHYRRGTEWCIYPMYDYAHALADSIEGVTHSLCTIEFENHRPLYDWFLDQLGIHHAQQIEFSHLRFTHTVLGKRKMRAMVAEGLVTGWDDPRMPTLSGLQRRGYTAAAILNACERAGVTKNESMSELAMLEHSVREDLNKTSPRVMAVLDPVRLVIESYPEGESEEFDAINNPEDPSAGTRRLPFSRELWIERDDFREDPPRKFFRLSPGREVRLRYAYLVTCTSVVVDDDGVVVEIRCTHDPASRGGDAPDGRRVKGTLHWVSAAHALDAEVRLYGTLFSGEFPEEAEDFRDTLNPDSLQVRTGCKVEPSLGAAEPGERFQFERLGYFCADPDGSPGKPVFNRTVPLRDSWARIQKKG